MDIRRATSADLTRIAALLEERGLPALPSSVPVSNVLVALDGGMVVGTAALEVVVRYGLVRSVVVSQSRQRQGVGSSLMRSMIARGHELGLREIYLLTEDASQFFRSLDFESVDRVGVPREIRATREYREQCPESAEVMRLSLTTRV